MWNRREMMGTSAALAASLAVSRAANAQTLQVERVEVDLRRETGALEHVWSRCAGSDRAAITLRETWRKDLDRFISETGLQRVRFHGIFNDELGVWTGGIGGRDINWQNVDQVYDGLLDRGVKPFVELSFMPRKLASGSTKIMFTYAANITPPASMEAWGDFIKAFVQHLVDRYGLAEVQQWSFEVWNEPNLKFFFAGTQDDYFQMYKAAAKAVKAVHPSLRVGGPSTAAVGWMPEFLAFCAKEDLPVDFVSTHIYAGDDQKEMFGEAKKYDQNQVIPAAMRQVRQQIDATRYKGAELWLSEWSSDSPAMIAHVITSCMPYCYSMSQWALSNTFEELFVPDFIVKEGDNGWGMLHQRGIAKPSFNTYKLLHRLGNRRLSAKGPALAARTATGSAALIWNLAEVQQPSGVPGASSVRKVIGEPKRIEATFKGAKPGASVEITYVDQDRGSPLPAWRAMGSPKYPTREQFAKLREAAELAPPETRQLDARGRIAIDLPPEGVALTELKA